MMNASSLDEKIEVTKAARLILKGLASEKFSELKDDVNDIPIHVRKKLFTRRWQYCGCRKMTNLLSGIRESKRYAKILDDGTVVVKASDFKIEMKYNDLHLALTFCLYEISDQENSSLLKRMKKLAR